MFGYATDLRSSTQGRANYTMQFERYEEVPRNIAEEIVEHRSGEPVSRRPRSYMLGHAGSDALAKRNQQTETSRRPERS